ncbi:MAG: type I DNA topoisomerase [Lachnospiraceae bacterium]|nr:type I DNA topoisomerase [Lachnospiraceae bacterium]
MANKLIIVESPTKVHTIKRFLGSSYEVIASQGHIRDLPKSSIGIDTAGDFEPKYITIRGKGEIMSALKKAVKKADKIYLATDPDREGEAISWHLTEALDFSHSDVARVTFNEITKNAVKAALKEPKSIDLNLVNAQQARRVLDRVVGYEVSPILWRKVKSKLSAGRVQSAVLRLIADREEEIRSFVPKEYWNLKAVFETEGGTFEAEYYGKNGKKKELNAEKDVLAAEKEVLNGPFCVREIKSQERVKASPYPFTTSTLQQDASNFLNFPTEKTMRIAQQLYEGVKVAGEGTVGLITYLRTDSTRIAEEADRSCKAYIRGSFGNEYVGSGAVKNKDRAQDAHEAIRPTAVERTPDSVKADLSRDQFRLYQLIWKRFVASRMKAAVYNQTGIRFGAGAHEFTANVSRLKFKGYLTVYGEKEENQGEKVLLSLTEDSAIELRKLEKEQHFTQPPIRFTEATLVRSMEELGLGRPSTYAPTITNILKRHYIVKEGRNLCMTELGEVVNEFMKKYFPDIVDLKFTAGMEESLDEVAEGKKDWHEMMKAFYPDFEKEVEKAGAEMEKVRVQDEVTDEICEKCGRNMVIKYGRNGKFLACPGFPECRNTRPLLEKAGIVCPKCGKELIVRRTKKGRRFYSCIDSEHCDFMSWNKPGDKPKKKKTS